MPCCGKKAVYRVILDQLFYKTKEFPYATSVNGTGLTLERIIELRAFVKDKVNPLIDYLKNNQPKLKNVGSYLSEKCRSSGHPVDHLITLFILNDILPAIKSFSYDRGTMQKLNKRAAAKKEGGSANLLSLLNKNLAENYLAFENHMIVILEIISSPSNRSGSQF